MSALLASPLGMIVVFGALLGGLILVYNYFDSSGGQNQAVQRRMSRIILKKNPQSKTSKKTASGIDISGGQNKNLFETIATRLTPRPEKLRHRLHRTGKNITIGQYLAANLIICIITFIGVMAKLGQPPLIAASAGIIVGMGLPNFYVNRLIKKRSLAFINTFPDAIDLVVRGVRSGLPIGESIKSIAKEMPEPLKTEFRIVNDGMKLGLQVEQALWECSNRLDIPEVKFFVIALSIQRETGGNLAETLENLSTILRKRKYMQSKIRAMSSEARASAMIIGSLPFIMFGLLMTMNPEYMSVLLYKPQGQKWIGVGLFLIFLGNYVMRKMASFRI